jgi:hypothetical protein
MRLERALAIWVSCDRVHSCGFRKTSHRTSPPCASNEVTTTDYSVMGKGKRGADILESAKSWTGGGGDGGPWPFRHWWLPRAAVSGRANFLRLRLHVPQHEHLGATSRVS